MSLLPGRRARWAVLGAVVASLAVGGIAWADVPDSGVINGCYQKVNGQLRAIDTDKGQACSAGEMPLGWNQIGPTGARGPTGAGGPSGATGATGPTGPMGPFPTKLPSGKTLTGDYWVNSVIQPITDSFAYPLSSSPTVHFVGIGATPPAECPGNVSNPQAAPGNLCVYAAIGDSSPTAVAILNPETNFGPAASPRGFALFMEDQAAASSGDWAVTAP